MAHKTHTTCAFFLIALLMFSAAKPLAHAQFFGSILNLLSLLGIRLGGPLVPTSTIPPPVLTTVVSPLVQRLNITGRLCCTPTGNCNATGSPPLSGALVRLNCTTNQFAGGSLVLGEGRTNITGYFNISVFNILGIIPNLFPILPCKIDVNLDQAVCPLLSTVNSTVNGTVGAVGTVLTAAVTPVSLLLTQLFGLILNLTVGLFVRVI